ncbi:MAG: hypothetical protein RLZZ621_2390 [Gemmatimonadota bacterium]
MASIARVMHRGALIGGAMLGVLWSCGRPVRAPQPGPRTASAPSAPAVSSTTEARAGVLDPPPRRVRVRKTASAEAPPLLREFRGVWVASVANIDWPSKRTLTTAQQQAELIALLDRAAALRLNAVVFQVRPAADALYASKLEPWSEYLTGRQGKRPDPYWDPLGFVIKEAHARNLELHAWFNPYRARHTDAKAPLAKSHIARTNPTLVKSYGRYLWMDPGEAAVRARTVKVVLDVVKRYDVDGVHIDDYFYPYPENDRRGKAVPFPDTRSYQRYRKSGGTLAKEDWRRRNVDLLVEELSKKIHEEKPHVRFGVSPFGIWRPGYPAQVRGFDAYAALYADARKWLREGWVDYFAPQLYWPTTARAQSYPALLEWWAGENVRERHLWPGNFTSLAGGSGSTAFPVSELLEQIRVTRSQVGASGNIHFSMKSFLSNQAAMNDSLARGPYADIAVPPASPWLKSPPPPLPRPVLGQEEGVRTLRLQRRGRAGPWRWVVRLRTDTAWITMVLPGSTERWVLPEKLAATTVTVSSLNRVGVESVPVTLPLVSLNTSSRSSSPDEGDRHDAP